MAVCPICGCKTDELDFVARVMNKEESKVCSFCNRQLNVFETSCEPTEAQLRWLKAVIDKDVPERAENVSEALNALGSRFSAKDTEQAAAPAQPKTNTVPQGFVKKAKSSEDDLIIELQNRITALENEMRTMKRKQMIKTIVELGAPFVLLILLVIVFLSSGIMDNFKAIFDMAGIAL